MNEQADQPWRLAKGTRISALVVDDVEDNREVLSGLLDRAGFEVAKANDGVEALEAIAGHRPDIVFMDVRMPVMDGLSAVREVRRRWPGERIVCVAITASGLLRPRAYYLDAGFDDFIGKPFRVETICDCMAKHLSIALEPEVPAETPPVAPPPATAGRSMRIPEGIRKRLLSAAEINALTEIEALIDELRAHFPESRDLADDLASLLSRYDTDGIIAVVRQVPHGGGEPPAGNHNLL